MEWNFSRSPLAAGILTGSAITAPAQFCCVILVLQTLESKENIFKLLFLLVRSYSKTFIGKLTFSSSGKLQLQVPRSNKYLRKPGLHSRAITGFVRISPALQPNNFALSPKNWIKVSYCPLCDQVAFLLTKAAFVSQWAPQRLSAKTLRENCPLNTYFTREIFLSTNLLGILLLLFWVGLLSL